MELEFGNPELNNIFFFFFLTIFVYKNKIQENNIKKKKTIKMSHKFFNRKTCQRLVQILLPKQFNRLQSSASPVNVIKLKIVPAAPVKAKTYIGKNEELKRALSPHLTIYKPQMSSFMSISVRMSGLALGVMAWVVAITELISDQNVDYFVNELKNMKLDDCYWKAAKTIVIFPFAFHLVAGLRHLLFDTSQFLEKPQFFATGCIAILIAFALDLYLANVEVKLVEQPKPKGTK